MDNEKKIIDIPRKINKIQAGAVDHVVCTKLVVKYKSFSLIIFYLIQLDADENILEWQKTAIGNYTSELDHVINF